MAENFEVQGQEFLEQQMAFRTEELEKTVEQKADPKFKRMPDRTHQQFDAEGQLVLQTEYRDTANGAETQAIQYQYFEDGGWIEHAKQLEGEKQNQEYLREHPMTSTELGVTLMDGSTVSAEAVLETLGSTAKNAPDATHQPWAAYRVTSPEFLSHFAAVPAEARKRGSKGNIYAVFEGNFGGGHEQEVFGTKRSIGAIKRISVDYDPDTQQPTHVMLETDDWKMADQAES